MWIVTTSAPSYLLSDHLLLTEMEDRQLEDSFGSFGEVMSPQPLYLPYYSRLRPLWGPMSLPQGLPKTTGKHRYSYYDTVVAKLQL